MLVMVVLVFIIVVVVMVMIMMLVPSLALMQVLVRLGGKVMGAGGGGLLLFCCESGRRKELRAALEAKGLQHMDFRFDWDGSRVMVNLS